LEIGDPDEPLHTWIGVDYAAASIKLRRKANRLEFRMALAGFEAAAPTEGAIVTPAM
jgi:hypothetical protein